MISKVYYQLDNGVPIGQEKDFQEFCDKQNAKRKKEIESLKDYDNARLALMKIDSLKIRIKELEREYENYKGNISDCNELIRSLEILFENSLRRETNKDIRRVIESLSEKVDEIIEVYREAPYYRLCEKVKKIEEENNWNKKN